MPVVDHLRQESEERVDVLRLHREQQDTGTGGGIGEIQRRDAIAVGQLRGPLGAALADQDPVGTAAADQAREQRLADLTAADDGQAPAAVGGHAWPPRRRATRAAAPRPDGTATRTA
jgi:hypothetical protein